MPEPVADFAQERNDMYRKSRFLYIWRPTCIDNLQMSLAEDS